MRARAIAVTTAVAVAVLSAAAAPALADEPPAGGAWAACTVGAVAAFPDRLVIKCSAMAGGADPTEFAIETMDRLADPVLRLAIEAKGRGKPLGILYVKEPGANPKGCLAQCRRIAAVELK
jgi:hypothetical protein